ncbi:MAG: NAD(P)H-dependent oxidoreductase [Flavobacteriales bacterium]
MHIAIISASVREGRRSHRVALHLERSVIASGNTADLLDLKAFAFPIFNERLKFQKDPASATLDFAERIRKANGVIIVTPEYNGGYPASMKNVVDLLNTEWKRKPIAISTVSDGSFGGTQVITSLLFSLWKIKAWVVNGHMPVPKVAEAFDETGQPADAEAWAKRTKAFLDELGWAMEARRRMEA